MIQRFGAQQFVASKFVAEFYHEDRARGVPEDDALGLAWMSDLDRRGRLNVFKYPRVNQILAQSQDGSSELRVWHHHGGPL